MWKPRIVSRSWIVVAAMLLLTIASLSVNTMCPQCNWQKVTSLVRSFSLLEWYAIWDMLKDAAHIVARIAKALACFFRPTRCALGVAE
jgi:hypothetical protein